MSTFTRRFAHDFIDQERDRQDAKWGAHRRQEAGKWLAILVEEVGEVSKALLEDEDKSGLLKELGQVAAVAVAWMEAVWERPDPGRAEVEEYPDGSHARLR